MLIGAVVKVAKAGAAGLLAIWALHAQIGGAISGVVVDPTGALIPNAHVAVSGSGNTAPLFTNAEGRFVSSVVPAGEYEIRVSAPGFQAAARTAVQVKAGSETKLGRIVLQVAPIVCDPGPKITFEPIASTAAEITGMVEVPTRADGPAGVAVTLFGKRSKRPIHSALSDSAGAFALTGVQPGTYRLIAHLEGYADFVVDSVQAKPGSDTRFRWALVLRACRPNRRCKTTHEFPPLVCL